MGNSQDGFTYPGKAIMRCRKVKNTFITATSLSRFVYLAGVDLDADGESVHEGNNVMLQIGASFGWNMPTDRKNLASWKFINCTGSSAGLAHLGLGVQQFPTDYMEFQDLPGQSGVLQQGPLEAQEYDITDGQKSTGGAATWNDQVIGGGSGHYKVRYGGSPLVWRRIG